MFMFFFTFCWLCVYAVVFIPDDPVVAAWVVILSVVCADSPVCPLLVNSKVDADVPDIGAWSGGCRRAL